MKATDFEYRRQTLVHQFIVAAAFLTYLIDRYDIVWLFVKDGTAPRELALSFAVTTLFMPLAPESAPGRALPAGQGAPPGLDRTAISVIRGISAIFSMQWV